jgi:hypothetical protein
VLGQMQQEMVPGASDPGVSPQLLMSSLAFDGPDPEIRRAIISAVLRQRSCLRRDSAA